MPGLTASQLSPDTLYPGDRLEYCYRAFVAGDPKGHRVAVVTRVDANEGIRFPVAVDTGDILRLGMVVPRVKQRLADLRDRRPCYPDPDLKEIRDVLQEVQWSANIQATQSCKSNSIASGTCAPTLWTSTFCTHRLCNLGAKCSNETRTLTTPKLFETERVGLGVNTTTDLDVNDVVGEYCGGLLEFPALVEGKPAQAVKQNSCYPLLYNAKSTKGNYVYVDALACGSITHFISHAGDFNAALFELQTWSRVKVLVKMINDVKAGTQIAVHYGEER
ncbi:hypothetical protein F442_16808 [Phytophthora nicotianae P10297]|uniref:SET domain-containing protein n=1 Tax=Phytophthora nicotianae P10297 TaxID=1317064 RepID=W2YJS8_PHYNI|nr:hypothetical protein F442_16808 [Phytophthora nicotianae P10297]